MKPSFRLQKLWRAFLLLLLFAVSHHAYAAYNAPTATSWTSRTGTLTVNAPSRSVGDVLIVFSTSRATTETIADPSGWTRLADFSGPAGGGAWCRIADNTATDNWAENWSGTSSSVAVMVRSTGGGWTDCSTIVAHSAVRANQNNNSGFPYEALTISTANTLVLRFGKKQKTATSDGATINAETGFTELAETGLTGSVNVGIVDYVIQTTASNISSGDWDFTGTTENLPVSSITLSLKSVTAPTFSGAPAVGTRTTSTIPVTATTACTDCNYYGVAVVDGSGAPTCTQIKAGQNSGGTSAYKAFGPVAMTTTVQNTGTFSTYTDGTLRDGYFCLNSTAGGDSAVSSIADMYKIPAFSVSPSVSAQSDVAYTLTKTLDGAGTVYAVACKKDATAPSVTDVEAAHCASASSPEASSNDDATGTFALGSALALPIYDIYVVGTYGSQHEAAVHTLADEMLDAPTGYQYITIASNGTGSPCASFNTATNPDIAAGDILKSPTTTSPGSFALTIGTDCQFSYSGDGSRQSALNIGIYDISASAYHADDIDFWSNNLAPIPPTPPDSVVFSLQEGVAITPIDLKSLCPDPENDNVVVTENTGLAAGLVIDGSGCTPSSDSCLHGTPTTRGISTLTLDCCDITGDCVTWH